MNKEPAIDGYDWITNTDPHMSPSGDDNIESTFQKPREVPYDDETLASLLGDCL